LDNKKTGKVIQHIPLPHEHILHIYPESENILWLSTKGGGIIRLNLKDNSVKQYTKQQGLPHNIVYTIQEDDYGYLWMSTDYGLARHDRQTGLFRVFQPSDGIPHEEFNHTSFYKATNGILYFGGINGIVRLAPKDFLIDDTYSNPIQLVRYQYFDTQFGKLIDQTQELLQKKEITLTHTDKFFILEFSPLDFVGNRNDRYAYKIEGLDQDWIYFNSNKLRINNLSAGQYTLLIKESNYADSKAKILRIPINVKQPFYLTGVFWLLITLLVLLVFLIYAKWRETKLNQQKLLLEQKVEERTGVIAKQAKELKELDQVKSRFFANISHELRTPLTLMIGPISAILEKHYGEDWNKITATLSMVQRNGIKLQGLIEEILLLSKLDAKKIPITLESTALFSFIQAILTQFEPQAEIKGIALRLDYQLDRKLKLELDSNKLEKIITNLLSNALKHTSTNGHIFLQIKKIYQQEKVMLQIRLQDEGNGIPAKDLPFIFDRFYQSDHNKTSGAGTGIGLSLVSELTTLLDGTIEVSSTLGTGSTFVLQLPFVHSPTILSTIVAEEEVGLVPSDLPSPPTNATLLIVEDNTDMINFLLDLLQATYTVHTAANGQIALDWLQQTNQLPDLILSDVMMPVLDGIELLSAVKKEKEWFNIPVILLTARANEQDKINALRIGVDDYLKKPFSSQELLARVANLIDNYHQRLLFQTEAPSEVISTEIVPSVTTPIPDNMDNWLQQLEEILRNQVGNSQFGILELAADLHLSERQLRRKIKTKTGLTPNQYFRAIKLDVARQFLEQKKYETVAEIAHKIGFSNTHYFSQIYQKQYGKKPIDYLKT
jgi:signal transduction histidine kinase/DNA-binding response OmpR family regulator